MLHDCRTRTALFIWESDDEGENGLFGLFGQLQALPRYFCFG